MARNSLVDAFDIYDTDESCIWHFTFTAGRPLSMAGGFLWNLEDDQKGKLVGRLRYYKVDHNKSSGIKYIFTCDQVSEVSMAFMWPHQLVLFVLARLDGRNMRDRKEL